MISSETFVEFEQKIDQLEQKLSHLKGAEQALKRERDFINEILHWSASPIVVIDLKGYIVTFNRASQNLSGYHFEDVRDKPFWEILISAEERDGVKAAITNVIDKGLPEKSINYWITKDGSKRLISWVNSILKKPDGTIEYILCTGQDITEQKKAEAALHQNEEKYRELVQHANSIILRIDTQGRVKFINEFAQSFFGFTEAELINQNIVDKILPPTESSGRDLKAMFNDIIQNPAQYLNNENENIKRDGQRVWVAWTNKAICDENGNIVEILCVGNDITERKKADKALGESEARFKILFEHAPDPIYINKLDGTIVDGNQAAERLTGYCRAELIGKNIAEIGLLTEDDFPRALGVQAKNRKGESSGPDEFVLKRKDETMVYAEISAIPVIIEGQELVLGIARDVMERRTAEKETKKLEAQLRQAQKMEAIGTLAGGIAHDFNNILSGIVGFAELAMIKTSEESSLHDNLQEIYRAGLRARDLVKQILTFSRQAEQDLQPVRIKLIIKEALRFLRSSLPSSINIRPNIVSDAQVLADPTQIHQVLMNLCANAKHAMRETGGVLEVALEEVPLNPEIAIAQSEAGADLYLKLTVADSGEGMPPEVREKIFDPFFTTKGKEEGTGLGLAVVHGVVKSCGGFITVSSMEGKGTIFNVFFPVIQAREEAPAELKGPIPAGSECVLLVDDEKILADIGQQMLERHGYQVVSRTSSIEALELFKAKPDHFDLVITDMTMPNMSGLELASEIIVLRPQMPIILCTGFSEGITPARAKAIGIKAFMMKPLALDDLLRTTRNVLDASKGQ